VNTALTAPAAPSVTLVTEVQVPDDQEGSFKFPSIVNVCPWLQSASASPGVGIGVLVNVMVGEPAKGVSVMVNEGVGVNVGIPALPRNPAMA